MLLIIDNYDSFTWNLAHYLESWGDAMAWDMTHLAVQPLIAPLYGGKTVTEILSLLADETPRDSYAITRDAFNLRTGGSGAAPADDPAFEKKWRAFIHDGFLKGSGQLPYRLHEQLLGNARSVLAT